MAMISHSSNTLNWYKKRNDTILTQINQFGFIYGNSKGLSP